MPIDPEKRKRCYNTSTWKKQRARLIEQRAHGRCECVGECGRHEGVRCPERHGAEGVLMNTDRVALQLCHRDRSRTGELVKDDELVCMCNGCHLRFDQVDHISNARRRKWRDEDTRARELGQLNWLDDDD